MLRLRQAARLNSNPVVAIAAGHGELILADISDVEEALCGQIFSAAYPLGLQNDSATTMPIKIYRGWPANKTLNADLLAGTQTITVFSQPNSTQNTSRYARIWRTVAESPPRLTVAVKGNMATLSGDGGGGQTVGLIVGGVGYAYSLNEDDTLQSAAMALATMIPGASARGVIITTLGLEPLQARVVGSGTAEMETRRQQQGLLVSVWCPTPAGRDDLAAAIDNWLSDLDWLPLPDGTVGRLLYHGTVETDASENASLYRRNLIYTVEYPTTIRMTSAQMLFGVGTLSGTGPEVGFSCLMPAPALVVPPLGAIRFDAWYDPANTIDQQCAAALSPADYHFRLPANAAVMDDVASWPRATQATMDMEISAAVLAGLSFWAFDSYQPDDTLSLALSLYLTSTIRSTLKFCMLGQTSNWGQEGRDQPSLLRDIRMMTQSGYMTVLGGRPLYLVLDASSAQVSGLPPGGVAAAIALVRCRVQAAGGGNPYVVWLSGAGLVDYSNIQAAQAAGADAAGAYAVSHSNGATQPYSSLAGAARGDWAARAAAGFAMIPTAMTGWDQRPLIESPQPFYPIPSTLSMQNYYQTGSGEEIGQHVVDLIKMVNANPSECPAQIGLIYAWNELAEGGWLMPTYTPSGPDVERVAAVADAIYAAVRASVEPDIALIK